MKSSDKDVAMQGIEFWSSLSEEEQNINLCAEEHLSSDTEDDDEDSWNPHKAASVCLMLMANACGNEIFPHILPFIDESYQSQNSTRRDASMIALGSLIDANSATQLNQILLNAHPIVLTLSKDQCPRVRDSALWALGKMYEAVKNYDLNPQQPELTNNLDLTVQSLTVSYDGLKDLPRVATNACWAFNFMVKAMYELASSQCGSRPQTLYISIQYETILSAVYETIKREDSGNIMLRAAAFALLNKLIECHPFDKHDLIRDSLSYILKEISTLFDAMNLPLSPAHITEYTQYQSFYFISLPQITEPLLHTLINYLKLSGPSSVQEEILQAIGCVIQCAPQQLISANISSFMPCVIECLTNSGETSLCASATAVLGDVCSACLNLISPFAQNIMNNALKHISSDLTDLELKIQLLTLCGDVALALGADFRIFLSDTLGVLKDVSSISASSDDDVDYINLIDEIKYTSLDTYTSIVADIQIWTPHISYALQLIDSIANDPTHSDSATCSSCGLIGDLLNIFKPNINTPAIRSLVNEATRSSASKTKNVGIWLQRVMETTH
ncbi:hypothetical protein MXB_1003 [Myxobolus squamalis]|nr:hypothetical protein MXB_1003 [Myxobolus squamalis]